MGAWMVIAAAAIHVLGSFDQMRGLRSIETKERIDEALRSMAGSGLGMTRDQMFDVMHVGLLVSAAAATAAIVMGIQALRRDRTAPWVLIGLSVLVFGGSLMFDPLMGMFLGAGTALLWSGPARDWFAGRPVRMSRMEVAMSEMNQPRPEGEPEPRHPTGPEPTASPPTQPGQPEQPPYSAPPQPAQPPAYGQAPHPYGQPPPAYGYGAVPPYGQPTAPPPGFAPTSGGAPSSVKTASIITIVMGALTALGSAFTMVALLLLPRDEIERALDQAMSTDPQLQEVLGEIDLAQLIAMVGVVLGVFVFWAAIATLLAIMTWRGHNWARILLVVSAGVSALFGLFGLPGTALHVLAAIGVIVLLLLPASNAWFRGGRALAGPYPGQPGYQPNPYQAQPPQQYPPQQQDPHRDENGKPPVW